MQMLVNSTVSSATSLSARFLVISISRYGSDEQLGSGQLSVPCVQDAALRKLGMSSNAGGLCCLNAVIWCSLALKDILAGHRMQ